MTLESALSSVEIVEQTRKLRREAGFDDDIHHRRLMSPGSRRHAVLHGNKKDPTKFVTARSSSPQRSSNHHRDEVQPRSRQNSDPLAPENVMRTSGRGVFL